MKTKRLLRHATPRARSIAGACAGIGPRYGGLCWIGGALVALSAVATVITVEPPISTGGYVTVPVVFQAGEWETVAGLQFDIEFDAANMSLVDVVAGDTALDAGKEVILSERSPGLARVIVAGLNQNSIADGEVVTLVLCPVGSSTPGMPTLESLVVSDPFGNGLPVDLERSFDTSADVASPGATHSGDGVVSLGKTRLDEETDESIADGDSEARTGDAYGDSLAASSWMTPNVVHSTESEDESGGREPAAKDRRRHASTSAVVSGERVSSSSAGAPGEYSVGGNAAAASPSPDAQPTRPGYSDVAGNDRGSPEATRDRGVYEDAGGGSDAMRPAGTVPFNALAYAGHNSLPSAPRVFLKDCSLPEGGDAHARRSIPRGVGAVCSLAITLTVLLVVRRVVFGAPWRT